MHVFPEWLAVSRQSCRFPRADLGVVRDARASFRRRESNGWHVPPGVLRIPDLADI